MRVASLDWRALQRSRRSRSPERRRRWHQRTHNIVVLQRSRRSRSPESCVATSTPCRRQACFNGAGDRDRRRVGIDPHTQGNASALQRSRRSRSPERIARRPSCRLVWLELQRSRRSRSPERRGPPSSRGRRANTLQRSRRSRSPESSGSGARTCERHFAASTEPAIEIAGEGTLPGVSIVDANGLQRSRRSRSPESRQPAHHEQQLRSRASTEPAIEIAGETEAALYAEAESYHALQRSRRSRSPESFGRPSAEGP